MSFPFSFFGNVSAPGLKTKEKSPSVLMVFTQVGFYYFVAKGGVVTRKSGAGKVLDSKAV